MRNSKARNSICGQCARLAQRSTRSSPAPLQHSASTTATAAAHALLGLARGVLNGLDDILEQMAGYASGLRGHIRVFANISAITQFLPDDLRSFMAAAPLVQVHLQERISAAIARAV